MIMKYEKFGMKLKVINIDKKEFQRMCKKYSETCEKLRELNTLAKELQRRILNAKQVIK
jgi:hypothetical protein